MASATPPLERSIFGRWTSLVWRAIGSARALVVAILVLTSLVVLLSLWGPSDVQLGAQGSGLGSVLRAVATSLADSVPGTRPARFLLAMVSALALCQVLILSVPGWSPLPIGACLCASRSMAADSERLARALARAFGAAGQVISWSDSSAPMGHAHARRRGVRHWLLVALPLGFLLLVVSLGIQATVGWEGPPQDLVLGEALVLNPDPKIVARLDELTIVPAVDGSVDVFQARVGVSIGDGPEAFLSLSPKGRTVHRGVTYRLLRYGPAMKLVATSTDGLPRELRQLMGDGRPRSVVRVPFPDEQQDKWLSVSGMGVILRLLLYGQDPQGSVAGPSVHIQVLKGRDGQVLEERFVSSAQQMTVDGLDLDLGLEYFVTVAASYAPHWPLTLAGLGLVLLGLLGWILWPSREAWILLTKDGGEGLCCQICVRRHERDAQWYRCILALLSAEGDQLPGGPTSDEALI